MNCLKARLEPPFPLQRPEITITPSDEPSFEVDWKELAWWFAVPEAGDHTLWAIYDDESGWRLSSYCEMKTLRPTVVHGIDGVEIAALDLELGEETIEHPWTFFARITEDRVQYLAALSVNKGASKLYTMLDENFDQDWGESQRRVRHTGRFVEQSDGTYRQSAGHLIPGETAETVGTCEVTIGDRSFTCIRVLDVAHDFSERSLLMEGYLTREGRAVLCRRYNATKWHFNDSATGPKPTWDERLATHNRIVIDGVTFFHWYDCLTGLACGIDAGSLGPA